MEHIHNITLSEYVPNLFIVGYPKCGTRALFELLRQHPDIRAVSKEPYAILARPDGGSRSLKGLSVVRENTEVIELYRNLFGPASRKNLVRYRIDASPDYIYFPMAAEAIKALSPSAHILICLREPLAYLRSLHEQWWRMGMFSGVVSLKGDGIPRSGVLFEQRIDFCRQIRTCYDVFGKERVHVILFEEFKASNAETMKRVYGYLGLPFITCYEQSSSSTYSLVLEEDFVENGKKYFRPQIEMLSELVGRDLIAFWGY